MKYASSAITFVAAVGLASIADASPLKREAPIVCQPTPIDQLWSARLKDTNANAHAQAAAANNKAHVNIIASEGLIGVDQNKVFYELYQDNPDLAVHFYVQQCNSTALNANQQTMNGDLPVKLLWKNDPTYCASAIDPIQAQSTSTPLQLKKCLQTDNSGQMSQFWAQHKDSTTLSFLGRRQNGKSHYWYSETGGGNTYRTPNVMLHKCSDANCQAGAVNGELLWDAQH
jgi:hypothetical protein